MARLYICIILILLININILSVRSIMDDNNMLNGDMGIDTDYRSRRGNTGLGEPENGMMGNIGYPGQNGNVGVKGGEKGGAKGPIGTTGWDYCCRTKCLRWCSIFGLRYCCKSICDYNRPCRNTESGASGYRREPGMGGIRKKRGMPESKGEEGMSGPHGANEISGQSDSIDMWGPIGAKELSGQYRAKEMPEVREMI